MDLDMLTKIHTKRLFSRMRIFITAESISTKFCTFTLWADVVIYLNRHPVTEHNVWLVRGVPHRAATLY